VATAKGPAPTSGAAPKSGAGPKSLTTPPSTGSAPRSRRASGARQSASPLVDAPQRPFVPAQAADEPRARRSPRTTANASRRAPLGAGRGHRGTG
jgi:hypothetical protein